MLERLRRIVRLLHWRQVAVTEQQDRLAIGLQVGGRLLEIWERDAPPLAHSRDRNDQMLWIGLSRVFRCLRSIRDLVAADQEADDAFILARAMTSTVLRSLWLAAPADDHERIRRGRVFTRYSYREARKQAQELEQLGMPTNIPAARWQEMADEIDAVGDVPPDVNLARELGFDAIYSTLYRTGSGSVHWTLLTALEGFDATNLPAGELQSLSGIKIRMHQGQPERAGTALLHACVLATMFLEASDLLVHHGMGAQARAILQDVFPDAFHEPTNQRE